MKSGVFINCISYKNDSDLQYSGVHKKVEAQCKILNGYFSITHDLHNMYGKYVTKIDKIIRRLPFTGISERWKYSDKYLTFDFMYFRKDVIDFSVYSFLKAIKKHRPEIIILMEIATYPYDRELRNGIKYWPLYMKDKLNRNRLKNCVDRIVTLSLHDEIFGIKTIKTMNGIDFQNISIAKANKPDKIINFIAVSSAAPWHGYDRLIKGISNYYRNGGVENIRFHVVGDGISIKSYKLLVEKLKLNDHVIFYGKMSGEKLDAIYDKCDIAIECLGAHRKDVYLSSSLKSREYCAKGLPMVTSTKIDFIDDDFPYCMRVPEDESDVDIASIIEFYHRCYPVGKDASILRHEIRAYGESRIDMSITMKPVVEYLQEELND